MRKIKRPGHCDTAKATQSLKLMQLLKARTVINISVSFCCSLASQFYNKVTFLELPFFSSSLKVQIFYFVNYLKNLENSYNIKLNFLVSSVTLIRNFNSLSQLEIGKSPRSLINLTIQNYLALSPQLKKFGKIRLGSKLSIDLIYDLSFRIQAASYFPLS